MQTTLHQLATEDRDRINDLVAEIVKAMEPEKIICYGCLLLTQRHWQACRGWHHEQHHLNCYLLIIPAVTDKRNDETLRRLLSKIVIPDTFAHYIIHKRKGVNEALLMGSRFFSSVSEQAATLYDAGDPLPVPQRQYTTQEHLELAGRDWRRNYALANSFYKGAAFFMEIQAPDQVVFCLHQCIEQLAMALLKALTGYRPSTHNLDSLLSLMHLCGVDVGAVFPVNSAHEELLYGTLRKSYSRSRYADEYMVAPETARILLERTERLMHEAEDLYQQQVKHWQAVAEQEEGVVAQVAYLNTLNSAS